jgi:YD repeat-containing protein
MRRIAPLVWLLGGAGCLGGPDSDGLGVGVSAAAINTTANQVGRLTMSGNGLAVTYHQYDLRGRAAAEQHALSSVSYVYTNTYGYPQSTTVSGPGSEITATKLPDGEVVQYTFDAGGLPQSVTATPSGGAQQTIVASVVRNLHGQTTQLVLGDGTEQDHCYNDGATCAGVTQPNTDLRLNGSERCAIRVRCGEQQEPQHENGTLAAATGASGPSPSDHAGHFAGDSPSFSMGMGLALERRNRRSIREGAHDGRKRASA